MPPAAPHLRPRLIPLTPNRVWRTYLGGRTLDGLAGVTEPRDSHFPEDWLASTTRATNPDREHPAEGVSTVTIDGQLTAFDELLALDPCYFLGEAHIARYGPQPQVLVKLLDPAIRLHFQAHPTADFARRFLGSPSGKTEAYHVLATRPEVAVPYIYLGFQRPPARADLRRMIEQQDLAAIEQCFDRIPVKPGDTYIVPGGVPHALGEGVFLVEIQEPSDLVVRFEFERGGYVLPESARFMNRGLDFCLDVFDYAPWSAARIFGEATCPPRRRRPLGPDSFQDDLIGPERTPCFRVRKSFFRSTVQKSESSAYVGIVTAGRLVVRAGDELYRLDPYSSFFVPAGAGALTFQPEPSAEVLECFPPDPNAR